MVVCRKSWLIFLENIILCTDKQPRLQGTKRSRHTSTISSLAAGEFAISIQARRIVSHVLLLSDITIVTVVLWYCCVVEGGPSDYVSSSVLGWEESRTGRTERVRRRRGGRGGGGNGDGGILVCENELCTAGVEAKEWEWELAWACVGVAAGLGLGVGVGLGVRVSEGWPTRVSDCGRAGPAGCFRVR